MFHESIPKQIFLILVDISNIWTWLCWRSPFLKFDRFAGALPLLALSTLLATTGTGRRRRGRGRTGRGGDGDGGGDRDGGSDGDGVDRSGGTGGASMGKLGKKQRENEIFVSVVYIEGTFSTGWSHQPVLKACFGQGRCDKFSPTSLAEGRPHWFINPRAVALSSSSPKQAYWA